jgi:hypothetical protein
MGPILHRLLSFRPLQSNMSRAAIIEEVSRIGTLLFLASVWRTFSTCTVHTVALRVSLLTFIQSYFVEWGKLRPLLLWTLLHAIRESEEEQERSEFAFRLRVVMNKMGIESWEEMLKVAKGVLWSEAAGEITGTFHALGAHQQVFSAP